MNIHFKTPTNVLKNINTEESEGIISYVNDLIKEVIDERISIVLIDCHHVTFMDSSGLGTLILTFKALQELGIKMVICSINEQVRMLFELTGMDGKFTIFPSQEAFENILLSAT